MKRKGRKNIKEVLSAPHVPSLEREELDHLRYEGLRARAQIEKEREREQVLHPNLGHRFYKRFGNLYNIFQEKVPKTVSQKMFLASFPQVYRHFGGQGAFMISGTSFFHWKKKQAFQKNHPSFDLALVF